MARYKYLGDDRYPNAGPCYEIKLKLVDGTVQSLTPISPAVEFVIGVDLGYDIVDAKSIRQLDVDPRFARLS